MHTWFGKSLAFVVEQVLSLHFTNVYPFQSSCNLTV